MGWCTPFVSHSPFLPMRSCSNETNTRVLWMSKHWQLLKRSAPALVKTPRVHAINGSDSLFVAIKSPAASGDYSVFIPISAAFFFLYWIANFVVPGMILKDLKSKEPGEKDEK